MRKIAIHKRKAFPDIRLYDGLLHKLQQPVIVAGEWILAKEEFIEIADRL